MENDTLGGTTAAEAAWPKRLLTDLAARYLRERHGLPIQPKTLRNWRAAGRKPRCRYFGTTPIYDRAELDSFVEEALKDECPTTRTRRLAKEAKRQTDGQAAA